MRRPLGFAALAYGSGLLLGEFWQPRLPILFAISLALAVAALLFARVRPFLLAPLIIMAGWTNLVCHTTVLSPNDLRSFFKGPEIVTLRGNLCATPTERIHLTNDKESLQTLAQVDVTAVCRNSRWEPAVGQILVTTPGTLNEPFYAGQEIEINGTLAPPRPPLAAGLFDYRTYLRRHGIYFQLQVAAASDWRLLSPNRTPPLSDRFLAWAKQTLALDLPARDEPLRLLCAMTLGSQNELANEAYAPFIESGTMHIFAISGLHIALIAGILVCLLRVLRVSRLWCGIIVVPLIWFYTGATGWQPSAARSAVMMSIIVVGWSLKRPGDLLNSLAAAGLVILVWDPQQLFQASFQLSFFVVLSIALFLPPLEVMRDRMLQHDPLLPPDLVPMWRRRLGTPLRFITNCLATSLAAWLGSWPLTVYYFHLFSPVTLLANMLIVPLSSAALAANMGSLICGAWMPWAAGLFNHSAWLWMWLMTVISENVIKIPGAFFYVPSLSLPDFIIYYSALIAVLSGFAFAPKRRVWMLAIVVCIGGFYGWRWYDSQQVTNIYVLPLNGGSAVYCDAPGRDQDLLIDCGDPRSVEMITVPFLHSCGLNRLPRFALSHGDMRHMGGVETLTDVLPSRNITISSAKFRSPTYRRFTAALNRSPERRSIVNCGDQIQSWQVLHPTTDDHFAQADDSALVLRGDFSGATVLLLSDLGRPGQEALLKRGANLRADIVVTGLPERGEPISDALLDAVQPRLIIVADSEFPATKRASKALQTRLEQRGTPVIYTRETGAVALSLRNGRWQAVADGIRLTNADIRQRQTPQ